MAASLKDIADELHVSISLVSKILSGRMGTSSATPEMRQAVQAKARELEYQPNRTAIALLSGRTGIIGAFFHAVGTRGSGVVERMIRGISTAADQHNQRLWLAFFDTDEGFLRQLPEVHRGELDGLIVAGSSHRSLMPILRKMQTEGVAVVTIHQKALYRGPANVQTDQMEVMRLPVEHVIDRGATRIAHIAADALRLKGFGRAMQGRNMPVDPSRVYLHEGVDKFEYEVGVAAIHHWLDHGIEFDAVVAQSDQQALGALHTLIARGVNVPEQVRITGIDDSPVCDSAIAPLTSVCEEYEQRGLTAVNLLSDAIAGKPIKSVTIQPTLHVRQST